MVFAELSTPLTSEARGTRQAGVDTYLEILWD
jgi:hypothetical protein